MLFRDYQDAVYNDACQIIKDGKYDYNVNMHDDFSYLWWILLGDDSVTGAGSMSYTTNRCEAQENIDGIFNDDDFLTNAHKYDYTFNDFVYKSPEEIDVLVREIALMSLYSKLEEFYDEYVTKYHNQKEQATA